MTYLRLFVSWLGLAALAVSTVAESYTTAYILFIAGLCCLTAKKDIAVQVLSVILAFYLGIALLNLAELRAFVTRDSLKVYSLCFLAFFIPFFLVNSGRSARGSEEIVISEKFHLISYSHIVVSFLAVAYIYATSGIILLNQELRFAIPTAAAYAARSSLFIPLFYFIADKKPHRTSFLWLCIASMAPSFLIGSRGTALTLLLALAIIWLTLDKREARASALFSWRAPRFLKTKKIMLIGVAVGVFIIVSGFYLRRTGNSSLLTPSELITTYFAGNDSWWIYIILPFYMAFAENTGIAAKIIDERIVNNSGSPLPLFYSDLGTVFSSNVGAAGQHLGDILGRVGDGGLTPGLVGGIYIDFGYGVILYFVFFGAIFAFFRRAANRSRVYLPLYAVFFSQFIHLFHRGFLKPEYFTFLLIALFYTILLHRQRKRVHISLVSIAS